jgi:nitrate reductase gamma subunit
MEPVSAFVNLYNNFFFIALPYIAVIVFLAGTIYRYRSTAFGYSSLSSQFLEGKKLFWGSIPFHIGILVVFLGHLTAFLFPRETLLWNSEPIRLIILEVTGFIFGLSVLFGLISLFVRRITNDRLRVVTTKMDIFVELLLIAVVILGCWIALGYRWGSSWFAADLSPYLWSIVKLSPQIDAVSAMPVVIKLHIILAFLIVLIFPFTRLVHFLVAPFHYIIRPYQVVIWNWDRKAIRDPQTPWSPTPPKNN